MTEQNNLIILNHIDERLLEIEELKGDLPQILNNQKEESGVLNDSNKSGLEKIDVISNDETKLEGEINTSKEILDKYNEQLYLLTSNKEYDALLLEIDHIKKVILTTEDSLLELIEDKETLKSQIEKNEQRITTLVVEIEQTEKELTESMKDTIAEEEQLNKDKINAIAVVDSQHFQQYQKLKKKYGIGMARINRNSCEYCFTHLPPQTIVEIQHDKKLINCPNCSVFLFYQDN